MIQDLNPIFLVRAFRYSMLGLKATLQSERSFRQELIAAAILIPLALWFGKTGIDKALMIGSVLLVLIVELINTSVETLVERISPEWHTLSGKAKDIGSASVMMAILNVAIVWGFVLFG